MMTKRLLRWTTVLLLSFALGLGAEAALAAVQVVGGLTREVSLQPGAKTEGRIILRNTADHRQDVKVYQTDYLFWADGRNDYAEPGSTPRSNARWITYTPQQVTLEPNAIGSVYYSIQVPQKDDLRGTYWSLLMVEGISKESLESPKEEAGKTSMGVRTVMRYAIQIVTNLGDTGERNLVFQNRQLLVKDGKLLLSLVAENTGERHLRPVVWAELYDEQGMSLGRFASGQARIYPGCSAKYDIDLSAVPPGKYKSLIVADNGDQYIFGAQYDLELQGEEQQ